MNYREKLGSCLFFQFILCINIFKMEGYIVGSASKQLRHRFLRQPKSLVLVINADTYITIVVLIENDAMLDLLYLFSIHKNIISNANNTNYLRHGKFYFPNGFGGGKRTVERPPWYAVGSADKDRRRITMRRMFWGMLYRICNPILFNIRILNPQTLEQV